MSDGDSSKSAIDRLGEALCDAPYEATSLRRLDSHRRSFEAAYAFVVSVLRERLGLSPTGRPAKSTPSIIDKLRRETTRLSQMQDIAGCRVIVADAVAQDQVVATIVHAFDRSTAVDRRKMPSHGYRAVHIIAFVDGRPVEIQVRTELQHAWAELSEKLSDRFGPGIKYGDGNDGILRPLRAWSEQVGAIEDLERDILANRVYHSTTGGPEATDSQEDLLAALRSAKRNMRTALDDLTRSLS